MHSQSRGTRWASLVGFALCCKPAASAYPFPMLGIDLQVIHLACFTFPNIFLVAFHTMGLVRSAIPIEVFAAGYTSAFFGFPITVRIAISSHPDFRRISIACLFIRHLNQISRAINPSCTKK